MFDLFRRTRLFRSISGLSPALIKVSAKYFYRHSFQHLLVKAMYMYINAFVFIFKALKLGLKLVNNAYLARQFERVFRLRLNLCEGDSLQL